MPTSFWKGLARIIVNIVVRGKFTTRMYDIFADKDNEENEKQILI